MKSWQILLMALGGVALVCCAGGGFLGYRIFNSAKAVDGEADNYADAVFPKIATNWDMQALKAEMAPEWTRGQTSEETANFLSQCKNLVGPLRSAGPFSAINTNYEDFNGRPVTYVTVASNAVFEKISTRVTMTLAKREDWKIVSLHLGNVKRAEKVQIRIP